MKQIKSDHPLLSGLKNVTPYPLTTSETLYQEKAPPMVISEFLPAAGVMGLTSYPGVGKTWLTLEVCRAVATGAPFLGKFVTQRGAVLFVGSDSSVYDYARQWKRLTEAADIAHDGKLPLFEPVRFLLQSSFMFENIDEVRRLIATCRRFEWGEEEFVGQGTSQARMTRNKGIDVIVFDTLSRLTRANQNDNTQMEEVFRNIRHIAEFTGAACILLHHNAKKSEFNDGSDWRGAMSQIGALDSWCHLTPARKDKYLVGVTFKKFRGITPQDFSYRMDVGDPTYATITVSDEPVTMQQRLNSDPLAEAIVAAITREPGRTAPELRDELWPQFDANGFDSQVKFSQAINNRFRTIVGRGRITKKYNKQGQPIYGPAETLEQS